MFDMNDLIRALVADPSDRVALDVLIDYFRDRGAIAEASFLTRPDAVLSIKFLARQSDRTIAQKVADIRRALDHLQTPMESLIQVASGLVKEMATAIAKVSARPQGNSMTRPVSSIQKAA